MKQEIKIIKISDTHYVGVDNSELKKGDISVVRDGGVWKINYHPLNNEYNKRIIYSTEPFKKFAPLTLNDMGIGYIPLSEVEEALYGYSVEKMAEPIKKEFGIDCEYWYYIKGFNAHKELTKDKFFSIEDMKNLMHESIIFSENNKHLSLGEYALSNKDWWDKKVKSLLPKTEWNAQIDENNKITLIHEQNN